MLLDLTQEQAAGTPGVQAGVQWKCLSEISMSQQGDQKRWNLRCPQTVPFLGSLLETIGEERTGFALPQSPFSNAQR